MIVFFSLFLAGVVAGILSSVVGMASLVSYPVLLAFGLPPVVANVTNTAGLIFSGLGATLSSRRELRHNFRDLFWILPLAGVGSVLGCVLLLAFPSKIFEKVAPFMIAAVAVFFIFQPKLKKQSGEISAIAPPVKRNFVTVLLVLLISMYGGYFGAASGIFMLIVFTASKGLSLLVANALKNVTMGFCNAVATVIFVFFGHVNWLFALIMGVGFVLGGYLGPVLARHLPARLLRGLIIVGAFVLSAYLFKQAYF